MSKRTDFFAQAKRQLDESKEDLLSLNDTGVMIAAMWSAIQASAYTIVQAIDIATAEIVNAINATRDDSTPADDGEGES